MHHFQQYTNIVHTEQHVKGKGNVTPLTRSDTDHTVLPANNTISAFTRKHSLGGGATHIRIASERLSSTYYSFIDPKRMNG